MPYKGLPGMTKRQRISNHCRLDKYKDRENSDENEGKDEGLEFEDKDQLLAVINFFHHSSRTGDWTSSFSTGRTKKSLQSTMHKRKYWRMGEKLNKNEKQAK